MEEEQASWQMNLHTLHMSHHHATNQSGQPPGQLQPLPMRRVQRMERMRMLSQRHAVAETAVSQAASKSANKAANKAKQLRPWPVGHCPVLGRIEGLAGSQGSGTQAAQEAASMRASGPISGPDRGVWALHGTALLGVITGCTS